MSPKEHFFQLGSHQGLSWAEILEVFGVPHENTKKVNEILFVKDLNFKKPAEFSYKFLKLGGSLRAGELIQKTTKSKKLDDIILNYLKDQDFNHKYFNLNIFGNINYNVSTLKQKIIEKYKEFTGKRLKITGDFSKTQANTATTIKVLKKQGIELNIIKDPQSGTYAVAKTLYVQDIKLWSLLDFKKPVRDMKVGMLPSKLARIMLNLSNIPEEDGGFWDPFCGLGTIIMQGQLLNLYSYGSDISKENLEKARKNIEWLAKKGLVKELRYRLFKFDIKKNPLSNKILRDIAGRGRFDAVVTEPFLGKPRHKPFTTKKQVLAEWTQIRPLYKALLRNTSYLLNPGGRIVMIVPMFKYEKTKWYKPRLEINLKRWKIVKFNTGELTWIHEKTFIGRQVVVVEKKG